MARIPMVAWGIAVLVLAGVAGLAGLLMGPQAPDVQRGILLFAAWFLFALGIVIMGFHFAIRRRRPAL